MTDRDGMDANLPRSRCAALAALLAAQRAVAAWGLMLSALAAALLGAAAVGLVPILAPAAALCIGATVLLGLVERYFAFRLRLDETLFQSLADGRLADLPALDDGLAWLGLRRNPADAATPRSLEARLCGTRALLRRHAGIVLLQTLLFGAALGAGLLAHP